MRIASVPLMTLLLASGVPTVAFAQVLTPFQSNPGPTYDERLDHAVPVATVSRVGDIVALSGARTVQDGHGEPFVLGGATLDLRDTAHAKVVFAMTNATETPVLLDDVMISEARLCSIPDPNHPYALSLADGRAGGFHGTEELQPGANVTVQIPIAPNCAGTGSETLGVLVAVHRPGPHEFTSTPRPPGIKEFHPNKDLFFRVFERLRAEASHQ